MASRKVSLKDRLLSNSPDPIKSSILRESGMGWNSTPQPGGSINSSGSNGSITSPLRIAKRDSESRSGGPIVARRTSSSYRHVHTNNLVSKSPFKSQIPTPATPSRSATVTFPTRRVSGEKRPRPSSMHELGEDENDRPFALKRERTQSKTFQGLIEKEPVTKSPFRSHQFAPVSNTRAARTSPIEPPLPSSIPTTHTSTPPRPTQIPTPSTNIVKGPSPGRSALVSRRMHGPRLSGGPKIERRKTVTFHERCDVLEFDRDESMEDDENALDDEDDDDDLDISHDSNNDLFFPSPQNIIHDSHDHEMQDDMSYESIQLSDAGINPIGPSLLDADASITGIVEQMFFASNVPSLADTSLASFPDTSTPPRHGDLPTDLETEDGVPFGRSHHVERFLQHQEHQSPHSQPPPHFSPTQSSPHNTSATASPSSFPFNLGLPTRASPLGPPATPPRRSPAIRHSTPPLGRSSHIDRIKQAREEQRDEEVDTDVKQLPISPSPMQHGSSTAVVREDALIPPYGLAPAAPEEPLAEISANLSVDPFAPRLQDEATLSDCNTDESSDESHQSSLGNISIGNSEINLSALASEKDCNEVLESLQLSEDAPFSPSSNYSTGIAKSIFHSVSPLESSSRSASPLLGVPAHPLTKSTSRERISRAEVQRRLMQRNSVSPIPDRPSPFSSPKSFRRPTPEQTENTLLEPYDKERDRLSVLTTQTDFSTETAIVQTVEKKSLGFSSLSPTMEEDNKEFGMLEPNQRLQFDFGSKFSIGGLALPSADCETQSFESKDTIMEYRREERTTSVDVSGSSMKMGDVDMDMKSALDRLMEDVAGAGVHPDESMTTDDDDTSYEKSRDLASPIDYNKANPRMLERAATDSVLLQNHEAGGIISRTVSGASTISGPPPPVPPKDSIRGREQLILEKRREARRVDEDSDDEMPSRGQTQRHLGVGRPSRRRSMSTGDAEVLGGGAKRRGKALLDISSSVGGEDQLGDSIEKELKKLTEPPAKAKYHVRERATTIYASSSTEQVSHSAGAGDLNTGRAWRAVRRPSDMNEYAKQIREYRAQDKGKAYGKVFVKVLGIRGMNLPVPQQPTAVTCTLNNGIHFVTTPECQLSENCRIDQEFELIEHSKLEFTLTLKVRRDPHIIAQFKDVSAPPAASSAPPPPSLPVVQTVPMKTGVMRSFFSSSPKKSKEKIVQPPPRPILAQQPQPVHRLPDNLARHLKPDGTLARAFISFKDVASRCDMRLFETSYPLIGQRVEVGGKFSTLEVGEIVLQMFRLPPLPGIPQEQLPQSLEECHRGLRHINWHKVTYFQGTLTQSGGDCTTWRRRQLRIIGSNLVAFNDVTKKATATIDLRKALEVIDDHEARNRALSPSSPRGSRYMDDDEMYGVERSFRLVFPENQEIIFFADTDEEKSRWLEVLRALIGHIPPHPLWAELLWQRQEEISRRMTAAQQSIPQPPPTQASGRPPFR